ncbi:MAG: VacJ family lipoprotein [Pseudomonadota bacterium]|nr:VacJ family lipoprotein [Pseudomonadota bacterium]
MKSYSMLTIALIITCVVAGCATPPSSENKEDLTTFKEFNDPYEPFNRTMLDFNLALDKAVVRPITSVYREVVPDSLKDNVHNFIENIRSPVIFANDLFQGKFGRAGNTLTRFVMNSTIGLLGFNDFATEAGIEKHDEDFGQTLATWDVDAGPYLVLPLFGPSNSRDAFGLLGDILMDPFTWLAPLEVRLARTVVTTIDKRYQKFDQINDLEENSLDFYSAVRSLYRQKRLDGIRDGAPTANKPAPGSLSGLSRNKFNNRYNSAGTMVK